MNERHDPVNGSRSHKWGLHKMLQKNEGHVIPLNDLREHELDKKCWCRPTEDLEYPELYMHHSADGREAFEEGRRQTS